MTWTGLPTWISALPSGIWVAVVVGNIALTAVTWSVARRRVRRAGQRLGDPDLVSGRQRVKDTTLTVASLVPAGLFWLMVLAGSFHGLVAFGRTTLGWRDGWEFLVPGTLDGVSVTFAMLAFRAIKRAKPPDRCYRVVWGAAIASATINFAHEYDTSGNALAGGYVGLLSLFGMVMFDEFLTQFEEGTASVRRENPKFGVRWLTWPTNTFLAAVAWRNHPPAEGTVGTVANAVANLDRVRESKRARRRSRGAPTTPGTATSTTRRKGEPGHVLKPQRDPGLHLPSGAATTDGAPRPTQVAANGRRPRREGNHAAPVPVTVATVTQWARTWMAMCGRPDLAEVAMRDDDAAREHFGCSARQLRHIRYAVATAALRRRAAELGVELPAGFDTTGAPQLEG